MIIKKDGEHMRFVFHGTLEELTSTIHSTAKERDKDIIIYCEEPDILKIGFQRLGHSGGRFFIANVTQSDMCVFLQGEIADIYSHKPESKLQDFWRLIGAFAMFYVLIELVLQIIWLPIFHFSHMWIPLMTPLPAFIFFRLNAIKEEKQTDADFIALMCTVTDKYCPYLNEYIDEGCCYDFQMILDGYMKDTVLPAANVDKTKLSKQCKKCKLK